MQKISFIVVGGVIMSITWDIELNESLRRVLLSLVSGKSLNLVCIAKELDLNFTDYKDKELLRQKMRILAREDIDLKNLAFLRGKYLIVESPNDMECLYLRYDRTSKTYSKKASYWHESSKTTKKRLTYQQLELNIDDTIIETRGNAAT